MVNIEKWKHKITELQNSYQAAAPFPHIVLDDFLDESLADGLDKVFPVSFFEKGWIHWRHYNEDKHGQNDLRLVPADIRAFIEYMNSDDFIVFLEQVTGINGLLPDRELEGGGLHLSARGGHLNIHSDFSTHPRHSDMHRRLNVILYLNRGWLEAYRGALEFWSADMKLCEKKIPPIFNRLVIFNTTSTSYHGFPDPIMCPEGSVRKSIALYYYNKTDKKSPVTSTSYKTRPGEGMKALPNWIDNKLLQGYSYMKRTLGINDNVVSSLLGAKEWIRRKREK